MNADALGEFLMMIFVPFIPLTAGAVIAAILSLLLIVLFQGFLPDEEG